MRMQCPPMRWFDNIFSSHLNGFDQMGWKERGKKMRKIVDVDPISYMQFCMHIVWFWRHSQHCSPIKELARNYRPATFSSLKVRNLFFIKQNRNKPIQLVELMEQKKTNINTLTSKWNEHTPKNIVNWLAADTLHINNMYRSSNTNGRTYITATSSDLEERIMKSIQNDFS